MGRGEESLLCDPGSELQKGESGRQQCEGIRRDIKTDTQTNKNRDLFDVLIYLQSKVMGAGLSPGRFFASTAKRFPH